MYSVQSSALRRDFSKVPQVSLQLQALEIPCRNNALPLSLASHCQSPSTLDSEGNYTWYNILLLQLFNTSLKSRTTSYKSTKEKPLTITLSALALHKARHCYVPHITPHYGTEQEMQALKLQQCNWSSWCSLLPHTHPWFLLPISQ